MEKIKLQPGDYVPFNDAMTKDVYDRLVDVFLKQSDDNNVRRSTNYPSDIKAIKEHIISYVLGWDLRDNEIWVMPRSSLGITRELSIEEVLSNEERSEMITFYTEAPKAIKVSVEIDDDGDTNILLNGHIVLFIGRHSGAVHTYGVSEAAKEELASLGISFRDNTIHFAG